MALAGAVFMVAGAAAFVAAGHAAMSRDDDAAGAVLSLVAAVFLWTVGLSAALSVVA